LQSGLEVGDTWVIVEMKRKIEYHMVSKAPEISRSQKHTQLP